ncbi:MAG: hypothetical protein DRG59_11430 [Deltaproteobacteria bacterium]|nr:MAG: hypothetical protein DRG59_11430 [Deltaproteobacteria bacterium]RLB06153.1 MAG: hypothetical protein DRG83_00920 [Deltaproteobacteria bacterium]
MEIKKAASIKTILIEETSKCRGCRFCVDVCPTYQASDGVESFSAYGRIQILRYLLLGTLVFDDSMVYTLYSCLQCKRCEVICKSKGQNLNICETIQLGRTLLSEKLIQGSNDEKI